MPNGYPAGCPLFAPRIYRAKGSAMNFSMKLTPKVEQTLWGAVGGAAVCALVGFMFGGWVTSYAGFWVTRLIRRRGEPAFQ